MQGLFPHPQHNQAHLPCRCKLDGMTNVGAAPRKCFCNRAQPNFAHPGQSKPTHCAKCKEDGMVNIRAATCACGKAVPSFATLGTMKATHCNNCKEVGREHGLHLHWCTAAVAQCW